MTSQILQLEDILQFDGKVAEQKITNLTKPGENYGSVMLKVDLKVQTSKLQDLHLVAKTLPDEATQKMFKSDRTFPNEIAFYKVIVPTLRSFQKENDSKSIFDLTPKYFGSRLNLKNDNSGLDDSAVLLLENLKIENYKIVDRTKGFNLEEARFVISCLAEFHAIPLALKFKTREVFEEKIEPHLLKWSMDVESHKIAKKRIDEVVDTIPTLEPLKTRILETFDQKLKFCQRPDVFTTLIHNDFWVNNVMFKFADNKPISVKIVDFQDCWYDSLARDVIFFLFSSVDSLVLEKFYEDLIRIYYQKFTETIIDLKCKVLFTFEELKEELAFEAAHSQFGHLMYMMFPIFAKEGALNNVANVLYNEPNNLHKQKMVFIINEFVKRNWL